MEERYTICTFCDGGCPLRIEVENGAIQKVSPLNPEMPAMCSKATLIDEYRLHKDRITMPLKNVGERGEASWEKVTWDEALDEIAARMKHIIDTYGPEAIAFAETPLNHGFGGVTRRLMNALGTPNYTAPTQLCMGNTAQVHRAVYGWFTSANWDSADCIVYFGQDRDGERWPVEYLKLKAARARGAKLIVVDPRLSATACLADYHLPINYGTDAALLLAWIQVIIEEELYDKDFVETSCIGFDELAERVAQYRPEMVADTCGIDADLIRVSARLYATSKASIIPWGVVGDMQVNSTSMLQSQCILRAICGFLNTSELVFGPALGGLGNAQFSEFERLDSNQRAKQLGRTEHPLLTFAAAEKYTQANARHGIDFVPDILGESVACQPPQLFAAMRGEGPYPVKAIVCAANNTVMSYAGQAGIIKAFMNQDLVVVFENWMTPTAQLADFVLPGDMWAERSTLGPAYDVAPLFSATQAVYEPVGECRSWYDVVKGLADRLGLTSVFPWETKEEMYDYRLSELGTTWASMVEHAPQILARNPVANGSFVTPSGKVELASSVLASLGFDPLPSFVTPPDPLASEDTYPYLVFAGLRERKSYNTCLHQIEPLRRLEPEPLVFLHPLDAQAEALVEGDWCEVASAYGSVRLRAHLDEAQPLGTLRIPHGWWKPETPQGLTAGLSEACLYNDGMIIPDDAWNLDGPQGVAGLRGSVHAKIHKI